MQIKKADYVVLGVIFIGDGNVEEALAVQGKLIVYVGNQKGVQAWIGENTKVIEVRDGMILPGITEGHAHVTSTYEVLHYAPLYKGESKEAYIHILQDFLKEHPMTQVLMGRGYRNGVFSAMGPQANLLDEVSTQIPIVLIGEDAHSVWINSKALELANINSHTKEVRGGEIVRYDNQTPTGWLKETAASLVRSLLPPLECEKVKEAILHYQAEALSNGITHVFEPLLNLQGNYEVCICAYEELAKEDKLQLRYQVGYPIEPNADLEAGIQKAIEYRQRAKQIGSDRYSLNTIKIFIDGVLEGRTAFLLEPYADQPDSYGEPLWTQERCNEVVEKAARNQFQVHIHTIGDGALDMAIQALQAAKPYSVSAGPHAVTHVQVVSEHQFDELAKLGVAVVVNPYWHTRDSLYFDKLEKPYLGKERAEREYPVASFLKAGCLVSQASDYPITICADPMTSLHIMVNRGESKYGDFEPLNPKEAVTISQALTIMTMNGAKQGGIDSICGSLAVGKEADFVILDKNVLTTQPSQLYTAKVKKIFIQGKLYSRMEESL